VEEPESEDTLTPLDDPFAFSLHNIIWLGGATVVVLTLVVMTMMGVIH
jgi:hypothetical protein